MHGLLTLMPGSDLQEIITNHLRDLKTQPAGSFSNLFSNSLRASLSACGQTMAGGFKTMHHPRSNSAARRLRIASLLLLANRILLPIGLGLLLTSVLTNERHMMIYGLIAGLTGVFLIVAQWIAASHAGCPLCRTPVLAPMGCVKHRKARRLLGSYKLRVALAIMFTERFRCPYCNESTTMDVREKLRGSRPRGSRMNN